MKSFLPRAWVVCAICGLAAFLWLLGAPLLPPGSKAERCNTQAPLADRVRDAQGRWFDGRRLRDCDADALVDAAAALERCAEGP